MNSERYEQIYDIFSQVQEMPPENRAAFLDEVCKDDEELRSEVDAFLESNENIGDFIEIPALEVAAKITRSSPCSGWAEWAKYGLPRIRV
jgi:hypothetical protein